MNIFLYIHFSEYLYWYEIVVHHVPWLVLLLAIFIFGQNGLVLIWYGEENNKIGFD